MDARELIAALLALIAETVSDSEGRYPSPNAGCIVCTVGTVPDVLNRGLCPVHKAEKYLREVAD